MSLKALQRDEVVVPKVDYTPAELDEPSRIMLKAAALLELRGHCHFVEKDEFGRLCFLGAAKEVYPEGQGCYWNSGPFIDMCTRLGDSVGGVFWKWNDKHTGEEVISKLRAVALGL